MWFVDDQPIERDPFGWSSPERDRSPAGGDEDDVEPVPRSLDEEDEDGSGDGGGDADSGVSSQQDDECLMTPSQRLDKYALSDNILYR